ncbi:MAG: amidohydrolase [Woeseiaceae bacterium]
MPTLEVSIVQADLVWHDPGANRHKFDREIDGITDSTDLIVLPEMFTTGFSMDAPQLAEPMSGESVNWMREWAGKRSVAICGSLIIKEGSNFYNRFICIGSDGSIATYDKRHLFRLADEDSHYSAGDEITIFEINGFRICPMVCYDLRFPVWSRNRDSYDLLLYVANWPSARHNAWATLLRARAIENLTYLAGVNRVGRDGNDLPYNGGSAIIDYLGNDFADLGDKEGSATATLDLESLRTFRERFAFAKDADEFAVET